MYEKYERVIPGKYKIVIGDQDGGVTIYILDPAVARKFRANCVFSYDGKMWIKTSGGRSLSLKEISLILDGKDLQEIKKFFNL